MFLVSAESRFEGDSTFPPQAANAKRWAPLDGILHKPKLFDSSVILLERWSSNGRVTMLKKCNQKIFVIISLIFIVGIVDSIKQVIDAKIESPKMIEVCQNALSNAFSSDRPGYTFYECNNSYSPRIYVRTVSSPLFVTVYFQDGTNDMWCTMKEIGSIWIVTGTATTIVAPCL
jgi:hypothetical protein